MIDLLLEILEASHNSFLLPSWKLLLMSESKDIAPMVASAEFSVYTAGQTNLWMKLSQQTFNLNRHMLPSTSMTE